MHNMTKRSICRLPHILGFIFFLMVLSITPLYFEDGYFNLLQAKGHAITLSTLLFTGIMLPWMCLRRNAAPLFRFRRSGMECSMLSMAAVSLVSCLFSGNIAASFWGTDGWCVGAFAYIGGAISSILLSRHLIYRHNLWLPVIGSNIIVFSVGILHAAGVDVFYLHQWVAPDQIYKYISTIGNLNWYAGYLCLLTPLFAVFYLSGQTRATRAICLLFLLPAGTNLVLCGSDSIFLGLGFCAFFALPYITADAQHMTRACVLLSVYGASLLFVHLSPAFLNWANAIHGVAGAVLKLSVSVPITLFGIGGAVLVHFHWDRLSMKQRYCIAAFLECLLTATVVIFAINSVSQFNDSWGTGRGRTWRTSLELFDAFSLKEKLIGTGPELLGPRYTELSSSFSRPILSAHSEPLQVLLTMGVAGLLCWVAVWSCILGSYFKKQLWKTDEIAFFLPLTAYLGQSLVNSPQPLNIAVLSVILAVLRLRTEERKLSGSCPVFNRLQQTMIERGKDVERGF